MNLTLIAIGPSHYCEKVAWALELAGMAYQREIHAPAFHVPAVKRAGGTKTTPVLVVEDGEQRVVLDDSTPILRWIQQQPDARFRPYLDEDSAEALALEERFDLELGPATRRVAYWHLLPHRALALPIMIAGAPAWEQRLVSLGFPLLRAMMMKGMKINAEGARRSAAKIDAVFTDVEAMLADGRPYLLGDRLSGADLTFAALAAPLLLPASYGAQLPGLHELPAEAQAALQPYIQRPAGAFGLRLYADHRRPAA